MQHHLIVDVTIEDNQPQVTAKEVGEQCEICSEVSEEVALVMIGASLSRWCAEALRVEL